eukprot:TRINITY_DN31412_c0_g1_i1.p1 TRINITY_DN31412_c0_g1~~TRINITY_DN31412_c0_g1_i1.p1  ORF type:complete len:472 (-),score=108.17 TRINITY_DN31412_c0_g1_i1:113-1528(-)
MKLSLSRCIVFLTCFLVQSVRVDEKEKGVSSLRGKDPAKDTDDKKPRKDDANDPTAEGVAGELSPANDGKSPEAVVAEDGESELSSADVSETTSAEDGDSTASLADEKQKSHAKDHKKTPAEIKADEIVQKRLKYFPGMESVADLMSWNETVAGPRYGQNPEALKLRDGPRIVSFHDMAGGYNEMPNNTYAMMFKSWDIVDMFVYFAHIAIVIPPQAWIALAHSHKTMVLGTIMFENENTQVQLLEANRSLGIQKLVDVADHYGLDGWLLNVESGGWEGKDPEFFARDLKNAMHEKIPHSQVLSYPYSPDSEMFKHSDGVFVQYNWNMSDSALSAMAAAAGDRKHDVYLGLDCFGGEDGGRSNSAPDPPHVQAAAKHELSLAIFAPGVTLENRAKNTFSKEAVKFDRKYWKTIEANFRGSSGSNSEAEPDSEAEPEVNPAQWPVEWTGEGGTGQGPSEANKEEDQQDDILD